MKRRRFLQVAAVSATLSGIPLPEQRLTWRWQGTALGAEASILVVHQDRQRASETLQALTSEIERLEQIFSLYRPDSDIVRLNNTGHLFSPPAELVSLLSTAQSIGSQTNGAFDPTVQPLWTLHANHAGQQPSERSIELASKLVDYRAIDIGTREIRFARQHMAVTLNGIAQGYITDKITDRLLDLDLSDVLVNLGEIRAAGYAGSGHPWQVGIAGKSGAIALENAAIATSSPDGTRFNIESELHHIFDPLTGRPSPAASQTSVIAPNATLADALATAAATIPKAERRDFCRSCSVEWVDTDAMVSTA